MFTKQNLLATLAGFLVMFLLGYAIWGFATVDFFEGHIVNNVMKETPDMLLLVLSNLIAAFALSSIYGKWARGHHSGKEGFQYGAWVGLFVGIGLGLLWYSTSDIFDLTGQLVNGVIEIVYYGLVGVAIALVYKATAPKETS